MMNRMKSWMEGVKYSEIAKPFIATKRWFENNVIKRKLVIFSVLFTAWLGLLLGAIYSPQRQTYTDDQLKTKRLFTNGTGEVRLTRQTYSPDTGVIVLQFETTDSTSPIVRGIEPKRLKWTLYAQQKTAETVMEVIPIVDNKVSVIIRNVPPNFGAYAIDLMNTTVATSSIDITITDPSSSENKVQKKSDEEEENVVQFYITPQNPKMTTTTIKESSREEFALSEIQEELRFQDGQIDKLNASIEQLKASIADDESRKVSLLKEAEYLSTDELEMNQRNIASIEHNMEMKNRSIEQANENIEKVKLKMAALEKKETAIKDGTFEFSAPIETVEMK
ncbi:hypothetical protein [Streptococcus suis]